ncbi:MAG: hypothetical protein NC299_18010 [Lachnospiraceae bacterium]|nr:hypothetical protein [Ruminococcus sp.]MCM1277223.1 hypothetical protein [Lachnospiraceae bacterium]
MTNRYWKENDGRYELHFEQFGTDIVVLKFCRDKKDPDCYWYVSEDLNIKADCNFYESIEEAKEGFELLYEQYLEIQIDYYKELLNQWCEMG